MLVIKSNFLRLWPVTNFFFFFAENRMIVHLQLDIVSFIIVLVVESVFK